MITTKMNKKQVGEQFINELEALLNKYDAVLEVNDDFLPDAPFGQDIRILVNIPVKFEHEGKKTLDWVNLNLGTEIGNHHC